MTFSQYVQSFICVDAPQCEEVKAWRVLNDAWKRAMPQVQFYGSSPCRVGKRSARNGIFGGIGA